MLKTITRSELKRRQYGYGTLAERIRPSDGFVEISYSGNRAWIRVYECSAIGFAVRDEPIDFAEAKRRAADLAKDLGIDLVVVPDEKSN